MTITTDALYVDFIAGGFKTPVEIGGTLKGSVVATGTAGSTADPLYNGVIHGVSIGFGSSFFPGAEGFNSIASGVLPPPFELGSSLDSRRNWFTALANDFSTVDSVIRADQRINSLSVKTMSQVLLGGKVTRARVESPRIDVLNIDNFDSGAVWSGKLNAEAPGPLALDIRDDYCDIGIATIGCMGPKADLWVNGDSDVVVTGVMNGTIHAPSLAPNASIRLGFQLGDLDLANQIQSPCFAEFFVNPEGGLSFVPYGDYEVSPRGVWPDIENNDVPDPAGSSVPSGIASYGRILIREPNGLHGQIIIDANNTGQQRAGSHWLGDVEIGTGDAIDPNISVPPEVISTARATTIGDGSGEGPRYTALPSSFGGGAVGLVPFALHDKASFPPNPPDAASAPAVILESIFWGTLTDPPPNQPDRIRLEFYGPISWDTNTGPPLKVEYEIAPGNIIDGAALGLFEFRIANAPQTNSPRIIEIFKAASVNSLPTSRAFKVSPRSNLRCVVGDGGPGVPVAPFVYYFRLDADCQPNGISDATDLASAVPPGSLDDGDPTGIAGNGVPDECDPVEVPECASCAADYDQDGGVTGGDIAAFLVDYEAGAPCADVDQDGGITGSDLSYFFTVYEAGGCP